RVDTLPVLVYTLVCFSSNNPSDTEIYTLSLHDALPISLQRLRCVRSPAARPKRGGAPERCRRLRGGAKWTHGARGGQERAPAPADRKSTRLNSSHLGISYAVFCLKKKNCPS